MLLKAFVVFCFLEAGLTHAAHAGFHVQYPWPSRATYVETRPALRDYTPFCGDIIRNPQPYPARSRGFLSFSGHPGDLVTALYTQNRVPREKKNFENMIFESVPIQHSGQLCVGVEIPFPTMLNEMGVVYLESRDPITEKIQHFCVDVQMTEVESLPEAHPAMCAANNETLIPMPEGFV